MQICILLVTGAHDCQWAPLTLRPIQKFENTFSRYHVWRAYFLLRISLLSPLGPTFIYKGPIELPKGPILLPDTRENCYFLLTLLIQKSYLCFIFYYHSTEVSKNGPMSQFMLFGSVWDPDWAPGRGGCPCHPSLGYVQGWNSQFCFWSQRIYNGGRICYISYVFMVPY